MPILKEQSRYQKTSITQERMLHFSNQIVYNSITFKTTHSDIITYNCRIQFDVFIYNFLLIDTKGRSKISSDRYRNLFNVNL